MRSRLKEYFSNGGIKDVIYVLVQFVVYLIVIGFFAGKFTSENHQLQARVCEIERKQEYLEEIKIRLTALEQNQQRILEILQGRYK